MTDRLTLLSRTTTPLGAVLELHHAGTDYWTARDDGDHVEVVICADVVEAWRCYQDAVDHGQTMRRFPAKLRRVS